MDRYTLEAEVTESHIYHAKWASWHRPDDDRRDPIVAAIRDAGVFDVKIEIHLNLIPPNHNWGILLNGKRYAMTDARRWYYDDFRIHNGDRNKPAVIQFCDESGMVDVRILPPDNRPEWEKRGMSYQQYHEQVVLGGKKPKPLTPLWMQQDSFPKWLQAKGVKSPQDAERTLKWLRKEDMSRELQWIDKDKGIPTAWYAAEVLAKQNGIRCIHREVRRGMDRRYYSVVRATIGHGKLRRTHGGASVWDNKEIAQCFAFRNATWQLLPMQPNTTEQTAWTDTKENVLATELRGQGLTRAESKRQAAEAYH